MGGVRHVDGRAIKATMVARNRNVFSHPVHGMYLRLFVYKIILENKDYLN